jgi:lactoylglutathione lyase
MRIDHIALWTDDLERLKQFYVRYFAAEAGPAYVNPSKGFQSCFLSFKGGARMEMMQTSRLSPVVLASGAERMGLTHFAMALGSEELVDAMTKTLANAGHRVLDGPRRTGDGYYESVVLDPDGNRIELTV